jgi:hypothetical protein
LILVDEIICVAHGLVQRDGRGVLEARAGMIATRYMGGFEALEKARLVIVG